MTASFDSNGDRLLDRVVELLRDRIIEEHYAPGQPLPRRRLADELNLAPTVVGEALRVLAREGLVFRGRRGEIRVALHDRSLLLDACELRYVIDGLAARLASCNGVSIGIALENSLAEQRAAIGTGDTRRFLRADVAFHAALLESSGNVFLRPWVSLVRWTCRNVPLDDRRMRLALEEHEAILAAVRARDPEQAESAAKAHIRQRADDVAKESGAVAASAGECWAGA